MSTVSYTHLDVYKRQLEDGSELYFVHSYAAQPEQVRDALALAFRGGVPLCAAAQRGNVLGCQFHPEKLSLIHISGCRAPRRSAAGP